MVHKKQSTEPPVLPPALLAITKSILQRRELGVIFGSFLVLNLVFFRQAFFHNFFWWDDISILNEATQGLSSIPHPHMGHFFPLFRIIMVALWNTFGLHHVYYQIVQISVQALNGLLCYLVLTRDGDDKTIAGLLSVLFCFAPVNVETVIWMCVLSQMLTATFFLLALLSHKNPLTSALFLFFSFSCFGGGVILSVPFVLYTAVRQRRFGWRSVVGATAAVVVFLALKTWLGAALPPTIYPIFDVKAWLHAVQAVIGQMFSLNHVSSLLVPFFALFVLYILYDRKLQVRGHDFIKQAMAPLVLFSGYGVAAYLVRGVVAPRHLYLPVVGLLWFISLLIHNLTIRRSPRQGWAGTALALATLFAMFVPLSIYANVQIGAWTARGAVAETFTRDIKAALTRQQGRTVYDTKLIEPILSSVTLRYYMPLLGFDSDKITIITDPLIASASAMFVEQDSISHYKNLEFWVNQFPDEAGRMRPFYLKYYPVALRTRAENLIQNGGFEEALAHWTCNVCSSSLSSASLTGAYAADVQFPAGGMLFQHLKMETAATMVNKTFRFSAFVKTDAPNSIVARLLFLNSANTQILLLASSLPHSGKNDYELLSLTAIAPKDAAIIGVDIASLNVAKPIAATVDDVVLTTLNSSALRIGTLK